MSNDALEQRITSLAEEITRLQAKFDDLDSRFSKFETESPETRAEKQDDEDEYTTLPDLGSDALWDKAVTFSLLPRIATTCFILVFALILRTLTDNNFIGALPGGIEPFKGLLDDLRIRHVDVYHLLRVLVTRTHLLDVRAHEFLIDLQLLVEPGRFRIAVGLI